MVGKRFLALAGAVAVAFGAPSSGTGGCGDGLERDRDERDPGAESDRSRLQLSFAMVHGAIYDAVNGIDAATGAISSSPGPPWDSKEAAAATAAFRVLVALVPPLRPSRCSAQYDGRARRDPGGRMTAESPLAKPPPRAMLTARANDGRAGPFPFVFGTTRATGAISPPPRSIRSLGRQRDAVPRRTPRIPHRGPNELTSRAYTGDFTRSSARLADEHGAHGGPDEGRHLLAGAAGGAYGGVMRQLSAKLGFEHSRERAAVRHGQSRRCRRRDRLLERQVPLELLAADGGDPEAATDGIRRRWPIRAGGRSSTRRR